MTPTPGGKQVSVEGILCWLDTWIRKETIADLRAAIEKENERHRAMGFTAGRRFQMNKNVAAAAEKEDADGK